MRWLQGRIEDQFVRAYVGREIDLLQRGNRPINESGAGLEFPKRVRKAKVLPGQTDIITELEKQNGNGSN